MAPGEECSRSPAPYADAKKKRGECKLGTQLPQNQNFGHACGNGINGGTVHREKMPGTE
jgi:hypothetical protein